MAKRSRLSIALFLACAATTALAQESGWYAGAAAGRSDFNSEPSSQFDHRVESDYTDTALAAYGGYRFGRYLGIEATYADLGGYSFTRECPPGLICVPELYPYDYELTARQWDLALLGILPIGERFEVYAKIGRARTEYDVAVRGLWTNEDVSTHAYDSVFGLGVRYHFEGGWTLRAQGQRTQDVAGGSVDFDAYWLGLEYRFGARGR